MKREFVSFLYLGFLLFSFTSGVYRYRLLDLAAKIFCIYLGFTFLTECIAYYSAIKFHTNLPVYAIFNIIELGFISMYFNYCIDVFRKYNIGLYILIAGTLLGTINIIFIQPFNSMSSNFLFFEGFCIISMSVFSFFRVLLKSGKTSLLYYSHFWITSLILLYWTCTYLYWGLFDYFMFTLGKNMWKLDVSILLLNSLIYCSFGIFYLLYTKFKVVYE